MLITDYTDYFRRIAREHPALQHSERELHFFRGEVEEFFQKLRSDARYPCLILEGSEVRYIGTEPIRKRRVISFMVVDLYSASQHYDEIQEHMALCERVADEILQRLLMDLRQRRSPFMTIDEDATEGQYLDNQPFHYCGYRLTVETEECI